MHCSYTAALLIPTPIALEVYILLCTGEALRGSVAVLGGIGPDPPKGKCNMLLCLAGRMDITFVLPCFFISPSPTARQYVLV
jgi:hypothetical protein